MMYMLYVYVRIVDYYLKITKKLNPYFIEIMLDGNDGNDGNDCYLKSIFFINT